jgi:hypothetical protein
MTAFAPNGDPIDVFNHYINFGAEYVYHCHILSHEEMDMMRPFSFAYAPAAPTNLTMSAPTGAGDDQHVDLIWTDSSISETGWLIQRASSALGPWTDLATLPRDPVLLETTGRSTGATITYSDVIGAGNQTYAYRVLALNTVGDTWDYADPNLNEIVSGGFETITTRSTPSNTATPPPPVPTVTAPNGGAFNQGTLVPVSYSGQSCVRRLVGGVRRCGGQHPLLANDPGCC